MQMDLEAARRRMAERSDDELRRILTVEADQYQPDALALAREELARRPPPVAPPALDEREQFRIAASRYRPARALTGTLLALVGIQLVAGLAAVIGYVTQWTVIGAGGPPSALADIAIVWGDRLRQVGYLVGIVLFCCWIHRMYFNLPSLGSFSARFTPSAAVWAFFIPFVNLVRGYQVVQHLWLESQPVPDSLPEGIVLRRTAPLVGWWWGLQCASNVLGRLLPNHPTTLDEWMSASRYSVAFLLAVMGAGVLFLLVVRRIALRQRDQWDWIVRRQPVPPTPDRIG